jgi:membrane fusion protein, multidrug efflux system
MKHILTVVVVLALAGCGRETARPVEGSADRFAPAGQTVAVVLEAWPDSYEAVGTVRARTSSVISSKVMGYVRAVAVQAGDRVAEGQTVVTIEVRDLDAAGRQASAAVDEARAAAPEADHGAASAKANLELARVTFSRIEGLFQKKSVSNQELDEAAARLKAAQAAHEMAAARRVQIDSRIAQAEQARQAAEVMRAYAEIRAPFAGVVTARSADPGVLATPGAPLLTIERAGAYRLEAAVGESRAMRIGQAVEVTLDGVEKTISGRVAEIVPAVDAASRAYTVKIDLPAIAELRSGLFGRARFTLGTRQVLAVPAGAVSRQGQLQSVSVVENGAARVRLVTAGQERSGRVEVLSGLSAGEQVEVRP